jgi:soluble lytic murein transglycosylase-like protein
MMKLSLAIACLLATMPLIASAEVPELAQSHQRTLTRVAHAKWGLDAPIALFAGQIHQESRWRIDARSPAGAQGLAQFMPATAQWFHQQNPQDLAAPFASAQPFNPAWALSALVLYDRHLYRQIKAANPCERWAFTLSAYNGGLTWLKRDQQLTSASGADPLVWFGSTEQFNNGRSLASYRENRHYAKQIVQRWQHLYASAGWGIGVCYAF